MSMDEVARRLQVGGRGVIWKWETGTNRVPVEQVAAYLDAVGATAGERRAAWLAYGVPEEDLALRGASVADLHPASTT